MQASGDTEEPPLPLALSRFQVSEEFGFLLPDPLVGAGCASPSACHRKIEGLTELPAPYGPWMDIAHELPQLIASHQLRSRVHQMPQLSSQHLRGREELHLAHLVLSFITMGYVWQEGEEGTVQVKARPLEIENLDTIITLPGGESLQGFILVTLLVEKAAVPGIKAISRALGAILQGDEETLHRALEELAGAIEAMREALRQMHDHVDPEVFYSEIRIFLSGWKDNPAMPHGLIYEGVSPEPLAYSGGSAAQSSVLHAFDELLGICHRQDCAAFLHRMRDYMPPPHRAFVEEIRGAVSLKQHVLSSGDERLRAAFNRCVSALTDFRSYHISIVTKYIATAAAKARARRAQPCASAGPALGKPPSALEAKGTGGSHIFSFLKSIRDTTREGMISA
ncbi:indoleamine 2,3-dioxygenase 2-like isoform X3 [Poecile atricapillus]|uniref:indoleamine 2,3-dioxygenase 2-like isoform X3 n=1 Tax=Poecile atricapillus TaxID=48891 RepID=UPI002739761A|nr:indoleamine 2,3-dioxygenase 2-like isoform X3 [Poecile atricapillus]